MQKLTRIVVPTSDSYIPSCKVTLKLLHLYWPKHPSVDIVAREKCIDTSRLEKVRCFRAGLQNRITWTEALLWYLERWSQDEIFLLLLDDYGLSQAPQIERVEFARHIMEKDSAVSAFYLTHAAIKAKEDYGNHADVARFPEWMYSVNTQAALWRRSSLIDLLRRIGPATVENFELLGSEIFNRDLFHHQVHLTYRSPSETPHMLDSDPLKSNWTIPYHNLVHRGNWDERHRQFLDSHGMEVVNPL